jgi:hypothetical protein
VLKKSFWGDDQKFLEPLMRFARGDMTGHIVSHKNDHGASYGRYGVLQWRSRLKISFCEIFRRRSVFDFCNTIGSTADAFGLMCIRYDQPEGAPPLRERYRGRSSSGGGGSWQSA